jgi:hypothetical protein
MRIVHQERLNANALDVTDPILGPDRVPIVLKTAPEFLLVSDLDVNAWCTWLSNAGNDSLDAYTLQLMEVSR